MNKVEQRRRYMSKWRESHPILAKRRVSASFAKHPTQYAHQRHSSEIRRVIFEITKERPKGLSLEALYNLMVRVVRENKIKAARKFPHGIPDAEKSNVEFKIGLDRLHAGQLVKNILCGQKFQVRWFPSYDSIEKMFQTGEDESKVFQSYKEFILWRYGVNNVR